MISGASATNSAAYLRSVGRIACGPAIFDPHVVAVGPAKLLQALLERPEAELSFRIVRGEGHEHANPPYPIWLLRARRERPCRRAADKRDELAPPHAHPMLKTHHSTAQTSALKEAEPRFATAT